LILGAGAAGLMAAGAAVRAGHSVTLLEHSEKPGQKILVTGKGRCNVTNACGEAEFLAEVRKNPRFLYSALTAFLPADTMHLFESLGVPLKEERGRRVFPVSDHAEDIRQALLRYAAGAAIVHDGAARLLLEPIASAEPGNVPQDEIAENTACTNGAPQAKDVISAGSADVAEKAGAPQAAFGKKHAAKKQKAGPLFRCVGAVGVSGREYHADAVLVATGGKSYPVTGSTGDGYRFARQAGHTIVPPVPSLCSLVSSDPACKAMMGLAPKNITLTLLEDGKPIFSEQGEMLFTHFGISGPLTLSASSHLGDMAKHTYVAELDWKPALSEEQLYARITRDFTALANHAAQGALGKLLPASMQPVMVQRWGLDPATKANQITREEKQQLVQLCKHWQVPITARGDLEHAVITAGGVDVRGIDPKTMQSKKAAGLYFAGEVLDVDAYTGGYNLQIAWCTAQAFARGLVRNTDKGE
jgi:predicted Rossmann fold flavoprotein